MTRITTGKDPSEFEEVYGARAADIVFPAGLLGSGHEEAMSQSFRVKNRNRGRVPPALGRARAVAISVYSGLPP